MNQNIFASETLFSAAYLNIEQTTDISRHYLRFSLHGRTVHLVLLLVRGEKRCVSKFGRSENI